MGFNSGFKGLKPEQTYPTNTRVEEASIGNCITVILCDRMATHPIQTKPAKPSPS